MREGEGKGRHGSAAFRFLVLFFIQDRHYSHKCHWEERRGRGGGGWTPRPMLLPACLSSLFLYLPAAQ